MSVIIEGMDLPSDCFKCNFCIDSGECAALDPGTFVCDYDDKRPEFCPLRPLSTPCGPVTLSEKLVPIDISETKEPCPWCENGSDDWGVIDEDFGQHVPDKLVNYCFHCGRKLK